MSLLVVDGVNRKEGEIFTLRNISFSLEISDKLVIAGSTGSGKTTLLKMIAGLLQPHSGEIRFEGKRVEGPQEKLIPGHPQIAYHSQFFELRNNYRVKELLEMANQLSRSEMSAVCEVCRVDHLLDRRTDQLSGGERQRISIARQLLTAPKLLLLDEPYSNLDPIHKTLLKAVISDISDQLEITTILVSHDPLDTVSWADEILVLEQGRLIQRDSPHQIYFHPVKEYTAALFGRYNVLTPALAKSLSRFSDVEMSVIGQFLRPQQFLLVPEGEGVKGQVRRCLFMGNYSEMEVEINDALIYVHTDVCLLKEGEEVWVRLRG